MIQHAEPAHLPKLGLEYVFLLKSLASHPVQESWEMMENSRVSYGIWVSGRLSLQKFFEIWVGKQGTGKEVDDGVFRVRVPIAQNPRLSVHFDVFVES